MHPATDDRTYYSADGTADRTADGGGQGELRLRRLVVAAVRCDAGSDARSRAGS
jgi:hypothetical protein